MKAINMVDELFNLGSAFAFVQTLPPGVYVAMNGKHFTANNVRKNKETGDQAWYFSHSIFAVSYTY